MKKKESVIYGLIITVVIYLTAFIVGKKFQFNVDFIKDSFGSYTTMLLLSIIAIFVFKNNVNYSISLPKFNQILKPILFAVLATIVIFVSINIITKILGGTIEPHPLLAKMTPMQVFVFVFIYASIAEELLFRGFLLNILNPLKNIGITILKRKISVSVIMSALAFGLAHLLLIRTGVGVIFLIRVVIFTTTLGLIAGYYQEKHDNNAFAIIVHMAGNSLAVIGSIIMSMLS
jgi:membrane protease YdiL (CAAX protease family)